MNTTNDRTDANGTAAIAENADPSRTGEAIRRVVELSGGMDWLQVMEPNDLNLVFDEDDSPFAVSREKREWITEDALRTPKCKLMSSQ